MKKFVAIELNKRWVALERGEIRFVISKELDEQEQDSILGAIGYAQAAHIRSRSKNAVELINSFIFGGSTFLDVKIRFDTSRRTYQTDALSDFLEACDDYIRNGVLHKTSETWLGAIGNGYDVDFYVEVEEPTYNTFTVTIKTSLSENQLLQYLSDNDAIKNDFVSEAG